MTDYTKLFYTITIIIIVINRYYADLLIKYSELNTQPCAISLQYIGVLRGGQGGLAPPPPPKIG